jgi:uncharacterized membrane protein
MFRWSAVFTLLLMLFQRRILSTVKVSRLPNRSCGNKTYVQTERYKQAENVVLVTLSTAGALVGVGFAYNEYKNTYRRSFPERVGLITSASLVGFGVGWGVMALSPILVPLTLVVGTICYLSPPPPPPETRGDKN